MTGKEFGGVLLMKKLLAWNPGVYFEKGEKKKTIKEKFIPY